jgi:hypothetical protein
MLLTHRKLLQSKAIAIENDLRGTLRNFGLKVGMATVRFEAPHQGADRDPPDLAVLVEPLLIVRWVLHGSRLRVIPRRPHRKCRAAQEGYRAAVLGLTLVGNGYYFFFFFL